MTTRSEREREDFRCISSRGSESRGGVSRNLEVASRIVNLQYIELKVRRICVSVDGVLKDRGIQGRLRMGQRVEKCRNSSPNLRRGRM